jgi:hypothetical protein
MRILSIDVGIKNLAICLINCPDVVGDDDDSVFKYEIELWDVLSLCEKPEPLSPKEICNECKRKAHYRLQTLDISLCTAHAKKSKYMLPTNELQPNKLRGANKTKLIELGQQYLEKEASADYASFSKAKMIDLLTVFNINNVLCEINPKQKRTTKSANEMGIVDMGVALIANLDPRFETNMDLIDYVLIENQISPIANRMKTLQGMISQYFIMRGQQSIEFVSAANKLKGYFNEETNEVPTNYAERKAAGINVTKNLLAGTQWCTYFFTHKKKDDLADAFLQGMWFLKKKNQPKKQKQNEFPSRPVEEMDIVI